jgi:hypothetical protein
MYQFRQLHKCQNGHEIYLFFDLIGSQLFNFTWGKNRCKCPKFKIGEGYTPAKEPEIIWGNADLKTRDMPKLPIKDTFEGENIIICPTCGNWRIGENKYCCDCGQRLDQKYETHENYSGV